VAVLIHEGWQFIVEVDEDVAKSGLIGFSINGEHKGNVRKEANQYRIGLGNTARRFPLGTPLDDVIREAAVLHLNTEKGRRWAEKQRQGGT